MDLALASLFALLPGPAQSDSRSSQPHGAAREFPEALAKYQVHPWEMLKFPEFRVPYRRAVGPTTLRWLSRLDGPANLNKTIQLPEGAFVLIDVCKPNACDSDRALILFRPQPATLWGLVLEGTSQRYLGNPPGSVRGSLKQRAAAN
jgi:inhibitor of lysozyme (Ivy)